MRFRLDLPKLCVAHAAITAAAGFVLIAAPGPIPRVVGIRVDSSAYLVCYLLAGAEFGMAALSYNGRRLRYPEVQRVVVLPCVIFHASSAALEVWAFAQGVSAAVWANSVARVVVMALFLYYGFLVAGRAFPCPAGSTHRPPAAGKPLQSRDQPLAPDPPAPPGGCGLTP